jgi:regulator of protease activity HflC (stomatin/prohibitin superfamily)
MINTVSGAKGLEPGSTRSLVSIEVTQIVLQEADLPDLVVDFADAHQLLRQRRTQVDLATVEADASAAGDAHGAIVQAICR